MARARRWLWGLVPLALLWGATLYSKTGSMEADIANRVGTALAPYGLPKSSLTVAGRDVSVTGPLYEAPHATLRSETAWREDADRTEGVRLVRDGVQRLPRAQPYRLSATRSDGKLVLSGNVPRPQLRDEVLAAARGVGGEINDGLGYAQGAPDNLGAAANLAIGQLAGLSEGKVDITGDMVTISGRARDKGARDAIVWALRSLPAGFKLGDVRIDLPSYDFTATKDAGAGTLTLSGLLPDAATRASLLESARSLFFRERVVDETKIEPAGAPTGFGEAALAALRQLARLDSGKLTLRDTDISLSGAPFFTRAADEIRAAFASLDGAFKGRFEPTTRQTPPPVDAAACQTLFRDLLGKSTILFETGSARIDRRSTGLLDGLVGTAQRCPSQSFEVEGHTDATGGEEINRDLSRRRAEAVAEYLGEAGIDRTKLKAVSYGASRPVASNDTEDGKAKNRRIEIAVK